MAERSAISRKRFEELVVRGAYKIWKDRESSRRIRDWNQALGELGWPHVFFGDPRYMVVKAKAEEIEGSRKDTDSRQDWFEAKHNVELLHQVRD